MTALSEAAMALHGHLVDRHSRAGALIGPDCGIRLNYRFGRFVKSYLRVLPWRDSLYYLQAQGHWALANWRLHELMGGEEFRSLACDCSRQVLKCQRPDGAWDYPHPGWKGRIATAEGTWGSMGLLESVLRTGNAEFLEGALRWHAFLEDQVGWQHVVGGSAVNYFAGREGNAVPNNSAFTLRFLATLALAAKDDRHLDRAPAMVSFLSSVQRSSGELPYSLSNGVGSHFQCYQYNAFQALDLIRYMEVSGDVNPRKIVAGLARFLQAGIKNDGRMPYCCHAEHPEVCYHLAAAAAALRGASRLGLADRGHSDRAFSRLLSFQRADGSFPHSVRDYGLLSDRRSYPRGQAMILHHLLLGAAS